MNNKLSTSQCSEYHYSNVHRGGYGIDCSHAGY